MALGARIGVLLIVLASGFGATADELPRDEAGTGDAATHPDPGSKLREALGEGPITVSEFRSLLSEPPAASDQLDALMTIVGTEERPCDDSYCPNIRPGPAGDLDGDGGEDVFTVEYADSSSALRARRGIDGSELWSMPIRTSSRALSRVLMGRMDVTGDSTPEVLVVERREVAADTGPGPAGARTARLDQIVSVLAPATGALVWNKLFKGSYTATGGPGFEAVVGADTIVVSIQVMENAGGTSKPDVFVGTLDWSSGGVAGAGTNVTRFLGHTIDGADGKEIGTIDFYGIGTYAYVLAANDVSGDGLADLISVGEALNGYTLASWPVSGGQAHWNKVVADSGYNPYPRLLSLAGDEAVDILVETSAPDGFRSKQILEVFDGSGGARLWSVDDAKAGEGINPVPDIDGDGGMDIVRVNRSYNAFYWPEGIRIRAHRGATGTVIWERKFIKEMRSEGSFVYNLWPSIGDLTADGIADLLVYTATNDNSDEEELHGTSAAIDGADGSTMWIMDLLSTDFIPEIIPDGDVNGNGTADVFVQSAILEGTDQPRSELRLAEGATAETLWTVAKTDPPEFITMQFGADVDGDDADEMVFRTVSYSEGESPTLAVEVYESEELLWRVQV